MSESKSPNPLKLLLVAEACTPQWSSVPLVAYNQATALARRPELDVTVVTHIRNRDGLAGSELERLACRITFIDSDAVAKPMYALARLLRGGGSLGWTTNMAMNWPGYLLFEHKTHRHYREQLKNGEFDLIHRLTPLSPTIGSVLSSRTQTPMLIGPLNGGLPWPNEFPELRNKEREWLVPIRNAYRRLPYYRSMYRNLHGVISGSRHTATEVPDGFDGRRFFLPENGIDPDRFPLADGWTEPQARFRFITVGRLVPYKAIDLTLEAMRECATLSQTELQIIGDGPQRAELERRVAEYGLTDNVRFLGWLSQEEVARHLSAAQAFVFPSLREFGGGVVLEAMASGLPSIIADYGGPSELITPETGIAIPMQSRESMVASLRSAMRSLVNDHSRCRQMATCAVEAIRTQFTWDAKARQIVNFYRQLLPGRLATEASNSSQVATDSSIVDAVFAEVDNALGLNLHGDDAAAIDAAFTQVDESLAAAIAPFETTETTEEAETPNNSGSDGRNRFPHSSLPRVGEGASHV